MTKQIFPVSPSGSPASSPAGPAPGRVLKKRIFPTAEPGPQPEPASGPSFLSRAASFGRAALSVPSKIREALSTKGRYSQWKEEHVARVPTLRSRFNPGSMEAQTGGSLTSTATLRLVPEPPPPTSTGEKVGRVAGELVGYAIPWTGVSKAAAPLTRIGPIGRALSKRGPVGQRIGKTVIQEGLAGGVVGGAQAAIEGQPAGEVAKQGGIGMLLGAGIPAATEAIGQYVVKPAIRNLRGALAARRIKAATGMDAEQLLEMLRKPPTRLLKTLNLPEPGPSPEAWQTTTALGPDWSETTALVVREKVKPPPQPIRRTWMPSVPPSSVVTRDIRKTLPAPVERPMLPGEVTGWEFGRRPATTGAPATIRPAETSAIAEATPPIGKIKRIPTGEVNVDPERFQFKMAAVGKGGTSPLLREVQKWDPIKAGVVLAWQDNEGRYWIVNGHHRLELAQRLKVPEVNAWILREKDGITAAEARSLGAQQNIAEGRGTAVDVAKWVRETKATPQTLRDAGLSLREEKLDKGVALSGLTDPLFNRVVQGQLPEDIGVVIGRELAGNEAAQMGVVGILEREEAKGRKVTPAILEETIKAVKGTGQTTRVEGTLFGDQEITASNIQDKAELIDYVKRQLRTQKRVFGTASKTRLAEMLQEAGNVLSGRNAEQASQAEMALELVDRLAHAAGTPISETLNRYAAELAAAQNATARTAIKTRALKDIVDLIEGGNAIGGVRIKVLGGSPSTPGPHTKDQGPAAQGVPEGVPAETGHPRKKARPEAAGASSRLAPSINRDIRQAVQARVGQPGEALTASAPGTPATPGRPYSQVTKRSEIIRSVSKDLSKPIYLGHVSQAAAPPGYTARGVFEIWPEVIRTAKRGDLRTIFHEVGHAIDKRLAMSDVGKLTAKQVAELEFLAKPVSAPGYTPDQLAAEGVAEFVATWTNKGEAEARALAPEFAKFFDAILGQEKDLAGVLRRSQAKLADWYGQSARDRILGSMSVGERSNQTIQTKSKPRAAWDRFRRAILDAFAPLENVSNELGRPMSPTKDPFKLAWLSRGSGAKAEGRIRFGYRNPETLARETEGLDAALKPTAGKIDDFRAYMAARRAVELESREIEHGLGKGMYSGDVQATFNSLNTPEFRKAFDALGKEYHAGLMDLVDSGRISKETAARIEALNKDYVPFKRVFEDALNFGQKAGSSRGFADLPKAVHEIKGSSREIIDPLESTVKDIYLMTKLADNNRVGRALADLADNTEGAGWWLSRVDDLGKVPAKENILTIYRNGEAVHYQVRDPDLYQAILSLDEKGTETIVKILSYPASLLRAGATLSPDFIARNPIRDQLSALVYSKYGFVPGVDLVKGIMHAVKQDELYQLYLESGAGHAALVSLDRDYLQGSLRKLLEGKNSFINAFKHPVATLQDISELMEVGTRLGEFERALAKEGASREGLMKAALAARDITVDFGRKGTKMGTWNRLVAFSNASVQGMDKMRRAFIENPVGTTVKASLAITLPSVLLWMVNKDDPWYHELPAWRKDLFWNIPAGTRDVKQKDGSIVKATRFVSIPKPFELGVIFGTVPERALTWLKEKDPKAMDGLARTIFDAGTPGFVPTAAVWAIEAWANRDLRTGVSIVPEGETGLEAWRQYGAATSETAKLIGKATNLSPRKIDNTIREVLGGLGKYGVELADVGLVAAGVAKPVPKPARTLSETPIAKAFAVETPQTSSASVDRFYREADALESKYQTSKKGGQKLRREEGTRLTRYRAYRQALSDLRQLRSRVELSKTMTPQAKRAELDRINLAMTNLARKALGEEPIK